MQLRETAGRSKLYLYLSIGLFLLLLGIVCFTFRDYGMSWDEIRQNTTGNAILHYFTSGFRDRTALDMADLNYYGGFFEVLGAVAQRALPFDTFDTRHLLSALTGVFGILAVWQTARFLAGTSAAFWAIVLLALYPPYYGHMFINSKDIPFAAFYAWAVYYLIRLLREFPEVSLKTAGKFALASGLTMAIRVGGLILLCYLGLFGGLALLWFLWTRKDSRPVEHSVLRRSLVAIAMTPVVAYALMLAFWPYGLSRPFVRPFIALRWFSHVVATASPRDYLPRFFAIKLPELILLLLVGGLFLAIRSLRQFRTTGSFPVLLSYMILVFSFLFPVCYAIAKQPDLYDEIRHFLFVVPPLICLAGIVLDWFLGRLLQSAVVGPIALTALAVYLILQIRLMWILHPYEYTYFNRLAGGIAGAHQRGYDNDYWATAYREGVEQLKAYLLLRDGPSFSQKQYKILLGDASMCATYYFPKNFVPVTDASDADFFLATTRYHESAPGGGTTVLSVERFGVPFVIGTALHGVPAGK